MSSVPRSLKALAGIVCAVALVAAACSSDGDGGDSGSGDDALRINHAQVVGSHNSYHLQPTEPLFGGIAALSPELAESIEYSHLPLDSQLDEYGVRQFELDVFADPDGGRYASRQALPVLGLPAESGLPELDEPGFKVLHTQDFDFETTCLTLVACLETIKGWSDENPDHYPLMIMIEAKEQDLVEAAAEEGLSLESVDIEFTVPLEMTPELFDDLEAEILSVFPRDAIVAPDDVRGDRDTLEEAVLEDGWPTIEDSRGKVLFSLVNTGGARDVYREGAPSLEGRLMFTSADPGDPDAAFVLVVVAVPDGDLVDELSAAGFLIRTRTDVPTVDARTGDTTRLEAALASGAHYLSTDYYVPNPAFGTGYVVVLPGGVVARCNPVSAPASCAAEAIEQLAGG